MYVCCGGVGHVRKALHAGLRQGCLQTGVACRPGTGHDGQLAIPVPQHSPQTHTKPIPIPPPALPCQGGWTTEEDDRLLDYINKHGKRWKGAGDSLGRLPDACRDRYREIWCALVCVHACG